MNHDQASMMEEISRLDRCGQSRLQRVHCLDNEYLEFPKRSESYVNNLPLLDPMFQLELTEPIDIEDEKIVGINDGSGFTSSKLVQWLGGFTSDAYNTSDDDSVGSYVSDVPGSNGWW